ncbi:MAG: ABC transporter ATP-binding protein [Spirochaetota bacterium]
MIIIEGVQKRYPEFDMELDLEVDAGELISILGPSGSGKTTTLRLIAGFEQPDQGRITIDGRDVTGLRPAARKVGYVFQDYTLFPHMNVAQNIGYGLRIREQPRDVISRRVGELLDLMELSGYESRRIETLSGGERQRVAIARALAVDPVLLMLDEPFSSIDEVLRRDLRREIVRLQKELGITVLFVTHSRQEALSISDRVAVLRQGRLIQYGSPVDLYREPADEFVAGFVGEVSFIEVDGRSLMLRPEDVSLVEPEAPTHDPDGAPEIGVRVQSRQFLGFAWLYELESERGPVLAYDHRFFADGRELRARLRGRERPARDLSSRAE